MVVVVVVVEFCKKRKVVADWGTVVSLAGSQFCVQCVCVCVCVFQE